jgi:hypothetical protein
MERNRAAALNTIAISLQSPIEKFLSEKPQVSRPQNAILRSTSTSETTTKKSNIATTVTSVISAEVRDPQDCPNHDAIVVQHLRDLRRHELFPIVTSDHPVSVFLSRIKSLRNGLATANPKILLCPGNCSCSTYSRSIVKDLDNLAKNAFAHVRGLCLKCVFAESVCEPFCPGHRYHDLLLDF